MQNPPLTHSVAAPFRIEPAALGRFGFLILDLSIFFVNASQVNEVRFSNTFVEKRTSHFWKVSRIGTDTSKIQILNHFDSRKISLDFPYSFCYNLLNVAMREAKNEPGFI